MWRNLERPIDRDQWSQAGGDVPHRGTSDGAIKSRSSIFTSAWEYVAHPDSSRNHFLNDLILAVDRRSYND